MDPLPGVIARRAVVYYMKELIKKVYTKNKNKIIFVAVLSLLLSVVELSIPYVYGILIDSLTGSIDRSQTRNYIIIFFSLLLVKIVVKYFHNINDIKFHMHSVFDVKMEILKHLRQIPLLEFQKFEPIYLSERIKRDGREIVNFFGDNYVFIFLKAIMLIVYIGIIGFLSRTMFYCVLVIVPLYVAVYLHYKDYIHELSFSLREEEGKSIQAYTEQLLLMEHIKIAANYKVHNKYVIKKFEYFFERLSRFLVWNNKYLSVEAFLSALFQVILFVFGAKAIMEKSMTIGGLIIISTYFQMIVDVINYYVNEAIMYQIMKVSYKRVKELMVIEEETNGSKKVNHVNAISADFSFTYDETKIPLKKYCFSGKQGQAYGLMGKNGCGKTTLLKLLIGLLPYHESGELTYNDLPSRSIDFEYMRRENIGYVTQKHIMTDKCVCDLFAEINESINLSNLKDYLVDLKDSDVQVAINLITKYWDKLYKEISEGEKQIIAFLRVLCKRPEILLLDEPTASLDATKKAWFKEILQYLKEHKLVIVISHDRDILDLCDEKVEVG